MIEHLSWVIIIAAVATFFISRYELRKGNKEANAFIKDQRHLIEQSGGKSNDDEERIFYGSMLERNIGLGFSHRYLEITTCLLLWAILLFLLKNLP